MDGGLARMRERDSTREGQRQRARQRARLRAQRAKKRVQGERSERAHAAPRCHRPC